MDDIELERAREYFRRLEILFRAEKRRLEEDDSDDRPSCGIDSPQNLMIRSLKGVDPLKDYR